MPKLPIRVGPANVDVITASASICTPAAGTKVVLRHIQATNTDPAVTHYFCLSIGAIATIANRIVDQVAIAPNSEYARWVTHSVAAAEIICAGADTTAKIALTINGDLITLG